MSPYFASPRPLAPLAAILALLFAAPAAAQQVRVLSIGADGAPHCDGPPGCPFTGGPCDAPLGTVCTPLTFNGAIDLIPSCVAPELVRYCCEADLDCPVLGGVVGRCLGPSPGDSTFGSGICVYTPAHPCLNTGGRTDAQILAACFRTAEGLGTSPYGIVPWNQGDCDGDRIANGVDGCVCDASNTCAAPDAGAPGPDAGPAVEPDAGGADAGERPMDAGAAGFDANLPPGTGLDFRGEGGCACAAGGGRGTGGHAAGPLLALGAGLLAWGRRRSRGAARSGGRSRRRAA